MPLKTFIGDLVLNDDYADRRDELIYIHSNFRQKLISLRLPLTTNLNEADFVMIFVTRCFLPRCFNLLSRIRDADVKHAIILCDKNHLSADEVNLRELLFSCFLSRIDFSPVDDELLKDCDPVLKSLAPSYLSTMFRDTLNSVRVFPDGKYYPTYLSNADSVVDHLVDITFKYVNRLNVDLVKAVGMEPDIFKITDLINKNAGGKATRFVVISGCRQTHDISTITKYLALEQRLRCKWLIYRENIPDEFTPNYADQLINRIVGLNCPLIQSEHLHTDGRVFKFVLVLNGVSSVKQLKEIRKLDDVCNVRFHESVIMLSTDVGTFKEFESYFQSLDSVFLGYVDGAAIADQSASVENVADIGRPFCVELDALQLGEIIAMADEKATGIPYSIGVMLLNYY